MITCSLCNKQIGKTRGSYKNYFWFTIDNVKHYAHHKCSKLLTKKYIKKKQEVN